MINTTGHDLFISLDFLIRFSALGIPAASLKIPEPRPSPFCIATSLHG